MSSGERLDRAAVEDFLIREAHLLDECRFEEWLGLFTPDAVYTVPAGDVGDGDDGVFIVSDDKRGLEERVWRLRHPAMHAQIPPSTTMHLVSNVQLMPSESEPSAVSADAVQRVWSNFIVYEVRIGEQRSFAGRYEHVLRREQEGWRIARKKVSLVNRALPLRNVTFLL